MWIELDLKCEYGKNIIINDDAYINFGCGILDYVEVIIGKNTFIGSNVDIYTANHAIDVEERINGGCYSKSINIGKNVWFGGNVKILAGVFISYNMIIGARSIFTKDVSLNVIAVGNSCKVIRQIMEKDKMGYKI